MTIRFVRLDVREVKIPFRMSFRHSLAERSEARSLLLSAHTDAGVCGYGEVVPRAYLTGETIDSAWDDLKRLWWHGIQQLEFSESKSPLETLHHIYLLADALRKTASYAGVDIAVVDAWARATNQPLGTFWTPSSAAALLTAPLGASSLKNTCWGAQIFRWLGFRQFKLKVGTHDSLVRVEGVRKIIGDDCDLRVDANCAWHPNEAIQLCKEMQAFGVSSVEQPIPHEEVETLARVQEKGGLPVMADESLCTLDDARGLVETNAAALWNVRLAKIGGFSGMQNMIALAHEHGIRLHLGVLVGETSLLAAAQRACLGMGAFAHVEYGFPRVLLKGDPFRGGPGGYFGTGKPLAARPGLGVTTTDKRLDAVTVRKESWT